MCIFVGKTSPHPPSFKCLISWCLLYAYPSVFVILWPCKKTNEMQILYWSIWHILAMQCQGYWFGFRGCRQLSARAIQQGIFCVCVAQALCNTSISSSVNFFDFCYCKLEKLKGYIIYSIVCRTSLFKKLKPLLFPFWGRLWKKR